MLDRNGLAGQLFGLFCLVQGLLREQPVQATTLQELRTLLGNRLSGGIVSATIQKFMLGEDKDVYWWSRDVHPNDSHRSHLVLPFC